MELPHGLSNPGGVNGFLCPMEPFLSCRRPQTGGSMMLKFLDDYGDKTKNTLQTEAHIVLCFLYSGDRFNSPQVFQRHCNVRNVTIGLSVVFKLDTLHTGPCKIIYTPGAFSHFVTLQPKTSMYLT